jgi:hypothetical protein
MRPWDYHVALTADRLTKVAHLLALGRRDAVDRHDPAIGGDAWTRGVCAYRYGCHRIAQAAGTTDFEWLTIIDPGKRFQFRVGDVPMRFWRGDPFEPNGRVVSPTPIEQFLLDLGDDVPLGGVLFRIGVDADDEGSLLSASFVALRNGAPETVWPIPLGQAVPLIVPMTAARPEGRELPPPSVGLPGDEDEAHASTRA